MNRKNNKLKGIAAGVVALALIFTGSLAWRDTTQHKTNRFGEIDDKEYNAVLVEDFLYDGEDILKINNGEPADKFVYVRNGSIDDQEDFEYGTFVVRIQFREWLGLQKNPMTQTTDRFMVNEAGNFVSFEDEAELKAFLMDHTASKYPSLKLYDSMSDAEADTFIVNNLGAGKRFQEVKNYLDVAPKIYIKTEQGDPHGIYGKFIYTGYGDEGKFISVMDGEEYELDGYKPGDDALHATIENQASGQGQGQQGIKLPEDAWSPRVWKADRDNGADFGDTDISEYIGLTMSNVISLEELQNHRTAGTMNQVINKVWVADTTDTGNGWVYWIGALDHSNEEYQLNTPFATKSILEYVSGTQKFLDEIGIHEEKQKAYRYALHINMDAVSIEDFMSGTNPWEEDQANWEIIEAISQHITEKYGIDQ